MSHDADRHGIRHALLGVSYEVDAALPPENAEILAALMGATSSVAVEFLA